MGVYNLIATSKKIGNIRKERQTESQWEYNLTATSKKTENTSQWMI